MLAGRARGRLERGESTWGDGQATAAMWIARIGVVAGVVAAVVFVALLASGFDFEQFRDDLAARARRAARPPRQRRAVDARRAARGDRPLGFAALPELDPPRFVTPNPFIKQYLMTAGPTPVPPAVSQAMAAPMLYHRAPAFDELYERVLGRLPAVFRTGNPVLAFAASGSGAMESAVANLVRPGTKALALAAGKFGERWIQLCEAYGAELVKHEPGWGVRFDAADVDRLLGENPGVEVVFATLSETSTGIVHDVRAIAEVGAAPRRAAGGRRRLGPGRDAPGAGRLGHRRRRRRLAEGADDAAGPRVRVGVRARARGGRGEGRRPLLLRLGPDREEPGEGREPVHPGRLAVPRASTSRSG